MENLSNKELILCFAQPKLKNKIEEIKTYFNSFLDKFERQTFWYYPNILEEVEEIKIKFFLKKSFINKEGKEIYWIPTLLNSSSLNFNYEIIEEKGILEEELKNKEKINYLSEIKKINKKESISSFNMEEGTYIITNFHKSICKGEDKTFVFVLPCNEDYTPKSTVPIITFGYFIEEELKKIKNLLEVEHPVYLLLGNNFTTPSKKQHKKAKIVFKKEN